MNEWTRYLFSNGWCVWIGIGWSMVIMSGIVTIYYNLIITWVLYFLGMSFTSKLPWSSCGNWWNTPLCSIVNDTLRLPSVSSNVTNATATTSCMPPFLNGTDEHDLKRMTAAEEFWQFVFLLCGFFGFLSSLLFYLANETYNCLSKSFIQNFS